MPDEKDDAFDIEIDDKKDDGAPEPVVEKDDSTPTESDPVAELKSQLDTLRQRADADAERARIAEQAAAKARYDAEAARGEVHETQIDAIGNAIAAETQALQSAKRDYAAAMTEGDFDKAADAQDRIATARGKLLRLDESKAEVDARKQEPAKRDDGSDPVEAYISQFSPRSQSWLRAHRNYVTDHKLNLRLIAAHNDAVADDHVPDSDSYFHAIERRLGLNGNGPDQAAPVADAGKQQRRSAPLAAPPSRDPPTSTGAQNRNTVTLTRAEVDIAESLGMTNAEYAKQKLEAVKRGDIAAR